MTSLNIPTRCPVKLSDSEPSVLVGGLPELKKYRRAVSTALRLARANERNEWEVENFRKAADRAYTAGNACGFSPNESNCAKLALDAWLDVAQGMARVNHAVYDDNYYQEQIAPYRQGSFIDTRVPHVAQLANRAERAQDEVLYARDSIAARVFAAWDMTKRLKS